MKRLLKLEVLLHIGFGVAGLTVFMVCGYRLLFEHGLGSDMDVVGLLVGAWVALTAPGAIRAAMRGPDSR